MTAVVESRRRLRETESGNRKRASQIEAELSSAYEERIKILKGRLEELQAKRMQETERYDKSIEKYK